MDNQFISAVQEGQEICMAFMTNKEQADMELSIKLREEGTITTPGLPFEQSQTKEIEGQKLAPTGDWLPLKTGSHWRLAPTGD
jgi:hypothetical protein